MAAVKVELAGGPHDGLSKTITAPPPGYIWVEVRGAGTGQPVVRFFRPADGVKQGARTLYRRIEEHGTGAARTQVYLYSQFTYARCSGCGVMHQRKGPSCTMCGAPLKSV